MVDSTRGIGPISNVQPGNRTQDARENRRTDGAGSSDPVDEINISQEALNVSEAERTAQDARAQLVQDQDVTLSRGGRIDDFV